MKKISMLAGLMVLSSSAFAATNTQTGELEVTAESKTSIAKGWKIALGASDLEIELESKESGNEKINDNMDSGSQLTFGYSDIKVNKIGYNVELSVLTTQPSEDQGDFSLAKGNTRFSANATYGINEKMYGFGGINSSRYIDRSYTVEGAFNIEIENESGIGYQLGAGYQVSEKFSLELAYLYMQSDAKMKISGNGIYSGAVEESETAYSMETKGMQFNLIGTF